MNICFQFHSELYFILFFYLNGKGTIYGNFRLYVLIFFVSINFKNPFSVPFCHCSSNFLCHFSPSFLSHFSFLTYLCCFPSSFFSFTFLSSIFSVSLFLSLRSRNEWCPCADQSKFNAASF